MSSRRVSIVESNSISMNGGEALYERPVPSWHNHSMSITVPSRFCGRVAELSEMIRSSKTRNPIERAVSLIGDELHRVVPLCPLGRRVK